MLNTAKRVTAATAVILAVSAPSVAVAMPAPYPIVRSVAGAQAPSAPLVQNTPASASDGFQLGDAAIGAAGMLVLIGAGGISLRRRGQHPAIG